MLLPRHVFSGLRRAFLLAAVAAAPVQAQQSAAPAEAQASLNGAPITDAELKAAEEDIGSSLQGQIPAEQKRDYLIGYVIDLKLAAAEAEKQKALSQEDIESRLAYFRQKVLMDALMAKIAKEAATEDAIKTLYEETAKSVPPEEEAHARHILVETEDEAKKIYERVKGGEDFAKLATEMSKDPGSGKEGGDLGWFTKDRMIKEFADAAFALKPGEISPPVKSQYGWHVIKLEERRTKPVPPLDQVKPQIEQYLMRKAQQDFILKLREAAKIVKPEPPKAEQPAPGSADPSRGPGGHGEVDPETGLGFQ